MEILPATVAEMVDGATLALVTQGKSGAAVWRADKDGVPLYFLKQAPAGADGELRAEAAILRWLEGKFPAARVVSLSIEPLRTTLLTTALSGIPLPEAICDSDSLTIVRSIGEAMAKLHRLTVNGCPFDMRLGRRLAWARERMERGEVDAEDFDDERRGVPVAQPYAELLDTVPEREELVFTHGDFCDANVLIDPDSLTVNRLVDWGRAGVSDRYQDIALMLRELEPQLHAPFWEAYGAGAPLDLARVAYYQALDEFF